MRTYHKDWAPSRQTCLCCGEPRNRPEDKGHEPYCEECATELTQEQRDRRAELTLSIKRTFEAHKNEMDAYFGERD